ncbi:MAG: YbaN family protein [Nitrospirota bacterium]|nr:YbaN family protein [Nitrospirota bacterium]
MIQSTPLRYLAMASGWVSLILGIIGIFLPLLPTTPFVLLSAYCFSRSSERLHSWLINQPRLGPMIQNWEQQGSISQNAKVTSTVLLVSLFSFSLFFLAIPLPVKAALVCTGASVLAFIWTRPLPLRHLDEFGNGPTDAREDLVRLG